jgi:hypothetical protein
VGVSTSTGQRHNERINGAEAMDPIVVLLVVLIVLALVGSVARRSAPSGGIRCDDLILGLARRC